MEQFFQKILQVVTGEELAAFLDQYDQLPDEKKQQLKDQLKSMSGQDQAQPAGAQQGPQDGSGPSGQREANLYG